MRPRISPARGRVTGAVACVLAWLALSWPWLTGQFTIPYDAKAHFHAQLQFLANAIHSGQSPFWTPNIFAGHPQIADPQSLIFSPAILIALATPNPGIWAIDLYALGLLAAAGAAILAFAADRGWHPAGGAVAAIAFAFGASAAWRLQHIGQIQSYALFAITLWLLGRALSRGSVGWGAAAGLAGGLMVAEPDQVALLAVYLLAGYAAAEILGQSRPLEAARRAVPVLGAGCIAGAAVALVPLVLAYLFIQASNRPEIDLAEVGRGSLHPASLLTALVGDLYGALDQRVDYWGPYSEAWSPDNLTLSQNMSQIYTGALPAVLLLTAGVVRGQAFRPEIRYFTIALGLMVVYGLGAFTPLFPLLYELPGVSLFRRPADATFMIGGLMAIVGGYLTHAAICSGAPQPSSRQRLAEAAVLLAVIVAAVAVAVAQSHLQDAVRPLLIAAACVGAAMILAHHLGKIAARSAGAATVLAAFAMTVDLALNNGPNESTALPPEPFAFLAPDARNETITTIKRLVKPVDGSPQRDRVELAGLGFDWPNAGLIHGFEHDLGYNPVRLDIVTRALGAGDSIGGWDQRQFTPLFPSYRCRLADLLGLRFIAVPASVPIEQIDKRLRPGDLKVVARTAEATIHENPGALPRALLVPRWQLADFDALVRTGKWPEIDPRAVVLLEHEPPMPSVAEGIGPGLATEDTIRMPIYRNTRVDIEVTSRHGGFVVLGDVWHPWWRVTVDGRPEPILRANVMFRAVRVGPGRHTVRFDFSPLAGALADLTGRSAGPLPGAGQAKGLAGGDR